MKERCQDKSSQRGCRGSGEAFRDPAKPYTDQNYLAYCNPHGGDERAKQELRDKRAKERRFGSALQGVKPLKAGGAKGSR